MIEVDVKSEINQLERLTSQLSSRSVAVATSRAINRAIVSGRVDAKKSIKREFNIQNADLKVMRINNSTSSNLTGTLAVGRKPISLSHFNPVFFAVQNGRISRIGINKRGNKTIKASRKDGAKGVSFEVFKGKVVNIPYAFIIKNDKQKPVFARGRYEGSGNNYSFIKRDKRVNKTGPDLPITKLTTTSIYGAFQNPSVNKNINTTVMDSYQKNVERELKNLIRRL